MKEEQKTVTLDAYEEGAVITALNDMRNKELAEKQPTDFVDELLLKILHSPQKKVKTGVPAKFRRDFVGEGGATEQANFCRHDGETSKRSTRRRDESR